MNNDNVFNKWNVWLEVIYDEVQGLLVNRQIYHDMEGIVRTNPKIQIESAFYEWMGILYASTQATGVRRQIDPRPDVISFVNLLGEIKDEPEVLDRERYRTLSGGGLSKEAADRDFDRYAGEGQPHIDPQRVDADLTEMRQKADKIRIFANRRIVHFDRSDFNALPVFSELDECLDLIETLLKKYLKLFRANATLPIVPKWEYDWKKIFKTPWIE